MAQDPNKVSSSGLRRRSVGTEITTPTLPMDLNVGFQISEGVIRGTPSPGTVRIFTDDDPKPSSSLVEFRKKQQSFEIHIEDCDEEEISGGSDDEDGPNLEVSRPHTPAQILQYPDYSGDISHREQPAQDHFLKVGRQEQECVTDVSEGESDNEEDTEDDPNMPESVIKRVPS